MRNDRELCARLEAQDEASPMKTVRPWRPF
jgi:hypothetical protein